MGYHTDFHGEFQVSRNDVPAQIQQFLDAGKDNHSAILVLADWCEERGMPEGEKLRKTKTYEEGYAIFHGLKDNHKAYIQKFNQTRRMQRHALKAAELDDPIREAVGLPVGIQGGFFVGGLGYAGQDDDPSVTDHNHEPHGQPGLWCQWTSNELGTTIEWDGGEKFYDYIEWLNYIIKHFLAPWGYFLNGEVEWQGEEDNDVGVITVKDNVVKVEKHRRYE
jgi:hypothetical protein